MTAAKTTAKAEEPEEKLNIYQILDRIAQEAGPLAPTKSPNGGVSFPFRGIDGTVAHLAPFLRKYGVVVVPEVLDRVTSTRELDAKKAITQTDLLARFTFYAPDGTNVSATTAGLAQDYSDRSAAQAQSVAFRVALLQTFALPTHTKEPEEAGEDVQKYIADAAASTPTPAKGKPAAKAETAADIRAKLQQVIADTTTYEAYTGEVVNGLGKRHSGGKEPGEWMGDLTVLNKIVASIKAGEME